MPTDYDTSIGMNSRLIQGERRAESSRASAGKFTHARTQSGPPNFVAQGPDALQRPGLSRSLTVGRIIKRPSDARGSRLTGLLRSSSVRTVNSLPSVRRSPRIKVCHGDDIVAFKFDENDPALQSIQLLRDKIRCKFGLSDDLDFRLGYRDDEGDFITVATIDDFWTACEMTRLARPTDPTRVRLIVN